MIEAPCPGHAGEASGHRLHVARRVGDQAMQLHVIVKTLHSIDTYIVNLRSNAPSLTYILHKFCQLITRVPLFHHQTSKDKFDAFPVGNIDWGKPFIHFFIHL